MYKYVLLSHNEGSRTQSLFCAATALYKKFHASSSTARCSVKWYLACWCSTKCQLWPASFPAFHATKQALCATSVTKSSLFTLLLLKFDP